MKIKTKLPEIGTSIFAVMSNLATEEQAINLSQGFPNFACDTELIDRVNFFMKKGHNQYAPMQGVGILRAQLSKKINSLYNISTYGHNDITITAGATQAIYSTITALIREGDEVIVIDPSYDSYRPAIELNGGIVKSYQLVAPNYRIDWDDFSSLVNGKTRMIITNTPHNPTGMVFTKEDILALKKIVARTDILILSDEVYEHLIYDNLKHESVLNYPELYKRSIAVYSFGKTFHATGWKVGYIVAPDYLTTEIRKVHQFQVFSVNTPVQYALADYLKDPMNYLGLPDFYQKKRDYLLYKMKDSKFKPITSKGTYFQLFDYSAISDLSDVEFSVWLTKMYKVATIPVSVFNASKRDDKLIRVCFAKTEALIDEAADNLKKVSFL